MSCCVASIQLILRRLVNEMSQEIGSAARQPIARVANEIRRGLSFTILALACCALQQAWVVTVAQTERPRVAIGNAGTMETTKSGTAGGVRSPALTGERRPLYRVTSSDVLELSFTFSPEYNQTITVQPDGFVVLKDLGTMYAEGTTLPQLQEAVQTAYAQLLNDPRVTIVLKDFDKPYFIAAGEVTRPGKYDLRGDTTVTEAVAMAGGFNSQARHSQVVLFRRMSDELVETRLINVKRMMSVRNLNEDMHLKPGDLLFVPQNAISKLRKYLPGSSLSLYLNPAQF
jgi:polysaccharide export outer membrane protein